MELAEGFQMETYRPSVQLLYEGSRLTNHHPILHVMFLHFCVQAGICAFNSWNAGILIYVLLQELLFLSVVSMSLSELKERGLSVTGCTLYVFFFSIHPIIQNYINLVTKDVIYASFLLLFILALSRNTHKERKRNTVLMLIASIGMMLFRNEGVYVLLLTYFTAFLLFKRKRRQYLIWLAFIATLYTGWMNIVLPFFRVSPGSIREMLSVPFMQTARIVKLFPEDITPEEKEVIRSVLDYERLPELYDERSADKVKATFKDENKDNLSDFLKVWGSISRRHPDAFIDAFFYWKYDFLYPSERLSEQTYNYTNCYEFIHQTVTWYCKPLEPNLVQPVHLRRAARFLEEMRKVILRMPLFDSLGSAAAYVWLMVIAGFDAIRRKTRVGILMLIPLYVGLAAGLVGPTAATYFRYMFSIVVALPFVVSYISIENPLCHRNTV